MLLRLVLILAACLAASPALAGATAWQEIAPETRLRLISGDGAPLEGRVWFALEVDMPQTTKTYWRTPGETGIPTMLATEKSTGLSDFAIAWPYPERIEEGGFIDYVYHGPVVLPLSARLTGSALQATIAVTMGICDQICVPVRAEFTLTYNPAQADPAQSLRIRQALAGVPQPDPDSEPFIGELTVSPDGAGVLLQLDTGRIDPDSIRLETPEAARVAGSPQKSPIEGHIFIPIFGGSPDRPLPDGPFRVTFLGQNGPSETSRTLVR